MDDDRGNVTRLLHAAHDGEGGALEEIFALLFDELRVVARRSMQRERDDHTLQPTALVNEVFMKLVRQNSVGFSDRAQFFGTAARVMRQVLVDHARRRQRLKRGGGVVEGRLDSALVAFEANAIDLIALDDALERLAARDERKARLVEMHFFAGLSMPEAAKQLDISERTAERDWTVARAWLRKELVAPDTATDPATDT